MKNRKVIPLVAVLVSSVVVLFAGPTFAASVLGMISKDSVIDAAGTEVEVVEVKCSSASSTPRSIQSVSGERSWCSQDIPTVCTKTKISMANKVCRFGFSADVQEYQESLAAQQQGSEVALQESSNAIAEPAPYAVSEIDQFDAQEQPLEVEQQIRQVNLDQVALEKERIRIEQQKLQIRRQELELNKRQLQLEP